MTPGELAARAEITDVLMDYADAIDTRNWAQLRALFTPDAVLDYRSSGGPRGPRDEVLEWITTSLAGVGVTQHALTNVRIRVDGETATASALLLNPLLLDGRDGGQLLLLGGRYDDRLHRSDGRWVVTQRVHTTTWTAGPVPARRTPPEA